MEHSHRFFENNACRYFPCHKGLKDFNCLFCYCPMYPLEACPGNPTYMAYHGKQIKDCTNCFIVGYLFLYSYRLLISKHKREICLFRIFTQIIFDIDVHLKAAEIFIFFQIKGKGT